MLPAPKVALSIFVVRKQFGILYVQLTLRVGYPQFRECRLNPTSHDIKDREIKFADILETLVPRYRSRREKDSVGNKTRIVKASFARGTYQGMQL